MHTYKSSDFKHRSTSESNNMKDTMVCFSRGPQAGSLTSHYKDSCVKEIDRRASSNQQLPPQAIHMHTPCDVAPRLI